MFLWHAYLGNKEKVVLSILAVFLKQFFVLWFSEFFEIIRSQNTAV